LRPCRAVISVVRSFLGCGSAALCALWWIFSPIVGVRRPDVLNRDRNRTSRCGKKMETGVKTSFSWPRTGRLSGKKDEIALKNTKNTKNFVGT
jgi:hypothetical protein